MKKIIILVATSILSITFLVVILVLKIVFPFKPSFYAYSSYVDERTMKQINEKYTYKEYSTVNDFEYAIENNKAIAGITSDYSIISLINNGKIVPIRKQIEEINNLKLNWTDYFTEESVSQMNDYDKYISEDIQKRLREEFGEYGENYTFKFSDFVVPYFINDKVIAYDTTKVLNKKDTSDNPFNFSNYPTLEEALRELTSVKSDIKIQWTKNERENIVNGPTIDNPGNKWSTEIDNNNYQKWVEDFATIILDGTNAPISDIKRNLFETDSDIILNNLINPSSKIDAAFIYNGDALDAYYGHDNFQEIQDGDRLRIIRTKYTIRILDCFVVSSSISKEERKNLLTDFNSWLFNGMFSSKDELTFINPNIIYEQDGIMRIFDYVNYTVAAKGPYEYIYENYFLDEENGKVDDIARSIYKVAKNDPDQGIYVRSLAPIEKETLSKLTLLFQQKLNGY
ncbi:MAG: hypothetical protein HDR43_01330 [Mycoplasma sp.]|nr:hypothetical protein [Mycoplasma sp.]